MPQYRNKVRIDGRRLIGLVGDDLERNTRMATVWVRDRVKEKLNIGQPVRTLPSGSIIGLDPSVPGDPPHKITGQLQASILTEVERTRTRITGRVGSNLKKAAPLEYGTSKMAARPYLRPTITENVQQIGRIIVHGKGAF